MYFSFEARIFAMGKTPKSYQYTVDYLIRRLNMKNILLIHKGEVSISGLSV